MKTTQITSLNFTILLLASKRGSVSDSFLVLPSVFTMISFYNTTVNDCGWSHRINKLCTMNAFVSLQVTAAIE